MTSGVNFNGNMVYPNTGLVYYPTAVSYPVNAAQTAVDYTAGSVTQDSTGSVLGGALVAGGIDSVISLRKAAKTAKAEGKKFSSLFSDYKEAFQNDIPKKVSGEATKESGNFKNLVKTGFERADIKAFEKAIPDAEKLAKMDKSAQEAFAEVTKWIERSKTATTEVAKNKCLLCADRALVEANAVAGPTSFLGKLFNKIPGVSKITEGVSNVAAESPVLAKCTKFAKSSGAGITAAIEGVGELITNVIPTFAQLGPEKGFKQLGKSTVKVAASTGGWVAGAAIGAAIGSVIPGAGTVVGGIIGGAISIACGMIGSSLCSKAATAITGKSELEIAKEEAAKKSQQIQQAQQQNLNVASAQGQSVDPSSQAYMSNPFSSSVGFMDKDILAYNTGYAA